MIGAKQFEPDALNKKVQRKVPNPLLDLIKPKKEAESNGEFRKLDQDLDKIKDKRRSINDREVTNTSFENAFKRKTTNLSSERFSEENKEKESKKEVKTYKPQLEKEKEEKKPNFADLIKKNRPKIPSFLENIEIKTIEILPSRKEQSEAEAKKPTITEEDINRISYKVFSNIRRYLDQDRDRDKNEGKKVKIELSL